RGLVEEDQIRLTALKVKRNDSYLISSGFFWGDISKAKITSSEMASKLLVNLSSLKDWVAAFQPERKIPYMEGIANLSSTSGFKDKVPYLNLKLDGEGIVFDRYNIGNVRMNGTLEKSAIKSLEGEIQNSSGKLLLQNFSMNLDGDYDLKVKASPNVEVSQFLHSIGLPKIPLKAQLSGTVQCEGKLKEKLLLNCEQAQAQVRGFHLFAPKDRKTIVKFQKAEATGSFTVTDKEVTYKAQLKMGEQSKGQSEGTIGYKEGFVISYSTEEFHFSDLESLSDLKLSGVGKIEGETRGNSDSATMTLKGSFEDFWLDDYALGKINSRVIYDKGFLHFKETNGLYGNTRYSGHLSLNLPESQIYVYLKSPYLELHDVKGILQKRLPIPVDVAGTGNAEFKGYGPLDITKMNYEVNADVFRGSVAGESFESINAKLRAREGVLSTEDLKIKKGSGLISFSGTLTPSWTINMTAAARDLRLEQSDRFAELGLDIQGGCNINTRVTGDLKNPTVELSGQTMNMHAGNFPVDDSNFSMIFKDKSLSGNANLLGSKIQTSFIFPLTEEGEFSLKANTKDLNISALFEAVSKARQTYDFETKASFDVDLYAKQGGFWKSTGLIDIGNFSIRRGGESLTSDGPMKVIMTQGVMNTENFGLSGENSYLKLEVRSSTKDRINGRLNGKLDLNILSPFVTFASEIRGILSLNTSFLGSVNDLNVSGSAYLDQGYIKANAFPHPFSEIRADMLFHQKSLFINSFQGSVADGKINGSGRAQYESPQSIPVQIDGHMKEVSINFPEGYFTKGSAQFSLSGQKFPYLFKIDYNVEHANIVSEFGGGSKDAEVRKSPYLPPSIAKATNEPFRMDLNLNFLSPIKISNSLLDASIKGDLRIEGDAQALVFSGGLTPIPGGTVFFRDVPFEITTGYIQYDNVAPDNAKLYLAATARVGEVTASQDK
ncbi:MAG TPA: hypothetical protein DCL41_07655, partial [Bdellovibrionales bacterium]|nr:hypothetical protein [Bdellovibrionales bacterium]